mmetsp:Transcript_22596/g.62419  ORF Transcript_22596/g.62419 Transcript_22596/m.62419 type:complete len:416 (-) Transcript_22596:614-1861(-)|eukprot:CAMPEP_0202346000 /NCGR_PEP_ID=MMETSP1126-20121109/4983_1 /ASSEMBLY_ACC=CAM_ASM_000457 /TAXON_ID=3047 /ORGANISM="Dunaliella tertiolecta, Strain CCMP1320" /LENGTH=415 /DNA_ID=CAMNT_0048937355 /DNA_START=82 /DNA_END=1329 /DNA_ORIENTATION=-
MKKLYFAAPLCLFAATVGSVMALRAGFLPRALKTQFSRLLPFKRQSSATTPYGNRVPDTVHRLVRTSELKKGRFIIVGDVHGCNTELLELLKEIKYEKGHDNLFFVGDLVNKGPQSVEVIRTFRSLDAWGVRGNHCDSTLRQWNLWRKDGSTPKYDWIASMTAEDAAVLDNLPFSLNIPELGVVVVHAGIVPRGEDVQQDSVRLLPCQDMRDMLCMRNLIPIASGTEGNTTASPMHADCQRHRPPPQQGELQLQEQQQFSWGAHCPGPQYKGSSEGEGGPGSAWAQVWPGPAHVLFGHDAKRGLQLATYATGLDTGCVYGKQLTAAVIPPLEQLLQKSSVVKAHWTAWHHREQQLQGDGTQGELLGSPEGEAARAGALELQAVRREDLPAVRREDLECRLVQVAAHEQYAAVSED